MNDDKDLKAYVTKLNDRNLQTQKDSGFTLYALLAALIIIYFLSSRGNTKAIFFSK